jgi:carboxypeptidase T
MLLTRIRGTKNQLRTLAESSLRLHRSGVRKVREGLFEVPAVLDESEVSLLELKGYEVIVRGDIKDLLSRRLKSAVDRPTSANSPDELFHSVEANDGYMEVEYIENWCSNLARLFPALALSLEATNRTWEGRTSSAIRLRSPGARRRMAVLFTAGVHAGELGGPDSCIYFLYRLSNAYLTKAPILLGNKAFSAEQVQAMVDNLDIYVFPCVNPDGRVYVQSSKEWWRKNRNPTVGMNGVGVDINRNYDFLWSSGIGSSFVPTDDTYKGKAAFSEPETQNVRWFLDSSEADFFLDIHGPSGLLAYTWGDALNQSLDPSMSFLNPAWDGKRTSSYREYLKPSDEVLIRSVGDRIVTAVNTVGKGGYQSHQSFADLYPTTATSDDYTYSRHLADRSQRLTYAYTLEYGGGDFFPPYTAMQGIINEVNAAMLELCDAMVALSDGSSVSVPAPGS